jgi:hypothetical protein
MAETIDDITCTWEENGTVTTEELDKVILSRGGWVTILFKYRELAKSGEWGKPKFTLRRYQKRSGQFRQQSKFNISSIAQARAIVDALQGWIGNDTDGGDEGDED